MPAPARAIPLVFLFTASCGLGLDLGPPEGPDAVDASRLDASRLDASRLDASPGDASPGDAPGGDDTGACASRVEECNGLDDNCNGAVDEGFDLSTDLLHCGACDTPCFADPHGTLECVAGRCQVVDCGDGRRDCNADAADGCETSLLTDTDCGDCGDACAATTTCVAGRCEPTAACGGAFMCTPMGSACNASCAGGFIECFGPSSCTCTSPTGTTTVSCMRLSGTGCTLCMNAAASGCCPP